MTIFRFDSTENLSCWMQSERRRELIARGERPLQAPPTNTPWSVADRPSTRSPLSPTRLAAEKAIEAAARSFDGVTGYELLQPAHDGGEWTSLYRFTGPRRYADEWLTVSGSIPVCRLGSPFEEPSWSSCSTSVLLGFGR
ncbi:hypothetical protein [Mycobacterium basiliense]|uniref:hypothetical protein n=1 Tax=Mycobacterium basiliense TaxID=2094119 RepID=UPI001E4D1642|nr:hypothetical protein [Mycobacterium basiliense]